MFVPGEDYSRFHRWCRHLPSRGVPDQERSRKLSLWLCPGDPLHWLPADASWQQEHRGLPQVREHKWFSTLSWTVGFLLMMWVWFSEEAVWGTSSRAWTMKLPSCLAVVSSDLCVESEWTSWLIGNYLWQLCWTCGIFLDHQSPVIFQLQLLTTWGDPYYIGLNGLEFYDQKHEKISLSENSILY